MDTDRMAIECVAALHRESQGAGKDMARIWTRAVTTGR